MNKDFERMKQILINQDNKIITAEWSMGVALVQHLTDECYSTAFYNYDNDTWEYGFPCYNLSKADDEYAELVSNLI